MSRAISLLYHDVVVDEDYDSSGFSGANPADYKLSVNDFEEHLSAIAAALVGPVVSVDELADCSENNTPVLFTFDDGGVSAYDIIAPALERYGWKGCFFVTTDRIDTPAFMSRSQIKELHDRGHAIGSHSCSHPRKITELSREQLTYEWRESLNVLSEIVGSPVTIASIPGGFYSRGVAECAYDSGVEVLFTSEPEQRIRRQGANLLVGRFGLQRGMGADIAVGFVLGDRILRARIFAYWNLKKVSKNDCRPLVCVAANTSFVAQMITGNAT